MIRILAGLAVMVVFAACNASADRAAVVKSTPAHSPAAEKFKSVLENATKQSGAVRDWGAPRKIARGAHPEILISGSSIMFNGRPLPIGGALDTWIKNIDAKADCIDIAHPPTACRWNSLGLMVVTDTSGKSVINLNIYLETPGIDPLLELVTTLPDGTPAPKLDGHFPNSRFAGYLELDGYGIDKDSMFWEIKAMAAQRRGFKCGLRSCEFPSGIFSESANINMKLSGESEEDKVAEISIGIVNYK